MEDVKAGATEMEDIKAGVKVLIEIDAWYICEYMANYDADGVKDRGLWVWHQDCPDVPHGEEGVNQESWLPTDSTKLCIVCLKAIPDEVMALVILYRNEV